jgi:hypothetical protein
VRPLGPRWWPMQAPERPRVPVLLEGGCVGLPTMALTRVLLAHLVAIQPVLLVPHHGCVATKSLSFSSTLTLSQARDLRSMHSE